MPKNSGPLKKFRMKNGNIDWNAYEQHKRGMAGTFHAAANKHKGWSDEARKKALEARRMKGGK